ncbi:MAG: polyprenyl synthetase family protein [Candidatus Cloacimonetes bacterium]|nr:polyprenyl synthetase family protein [Candidatus Cloacimonadota bacterium]
MSQNKMLLKRDIKEKKELVNIEMDRFLPRKDEYPKQIHKAIRHTLFAGGKRLRPYLLIHSYLLFADNVKSILPVAGAIEMLHTYTLIHDDLPEIDNDDYRRGKLSCHVVYGSDMALLAGDALLVGAFEAINSSDIEARLKLQLIKEFGEEMGHNGLIAGQMADIISEGKKANEKTLNYIHANKTARLINLPIRFGCLLGNANEKDMLTMRKFGEKIGLAFQIMDDILDIEGDSEELGKTTGKDDQANKMTYPAVYGLEKSHQMAENLISEARKKLEKFGEKGIYLDLLANFILTRKY